MISYSNISAIIVDVDQLVIEPIYDEFDDLPLYQRQIIIKTKKGETFTLTLQATKKQYLQVHKKLKYENWLTPTVYTGNVSDDEEQESD